MLKKVFIFMVALTAFATLLYGQPKSGLNFSPPDLPDGLYGSHYGNQQISVNGPMPQYSFSISAGSLPPGISLNSKGVISGTPTAAGTYSFTVKAKRQNGGAKKDSGSHDYTLVIDQAVLKIQANNATMTYGGTVPPLAVTYSGFANGDHASDLTAPPAITTTATPASPAGTYPITVSGAVDSNYSFTYQAGTLTVSKATLTVTADNKSMPLGGPVPALTVSYAGFVNGDNASSLTTQPAVTTSAQANSPSGTYPITAHGGSSPNYTFSYVNGILTVAQAQAVLTITANPAGSVYGAPLVPGGSLTVSYSGFINGDGPGSMTKLPTVTNSAVPGAPAGAYTLTPSGAVNPNYVIQYVTGNYTISPAPLTVTAVSKTMIYGGTLPALTASYTGFVNGDNVSSLVTPPAITTTAAAISVAGNYPITASGAVDPNYTIAYQPGVLTVGKAALTVTADNKAMPLGGPLPLLTVSYTGFVNGDKSSSLTTQPVATTTANAKSSPGTYPITASGGSSPNYSFTYVNGTLTVAQAQAQPVLTITANPASSVYGAPLASGNALTVSYSGFINGDGPGNMTKQPTVTNSAVPGAPAGAYTLTPSGAVDPNYIIQYVSGVYTIHPAPLNIAANNQTMIYGGTVPTLTAAYSGFVNGDKVSSLATAPTITTSATSTSPAGVYPITASGAADPNYNITYSPGTLTISPAALLLVIANPQTKKYGTPDPTFTYTASGFLNGDNSGIFTGSLSRASGENVGSYPITQGSLSAGSNYAIRFTGNYLTITKASQAITWTQSLLVGCNTTTQVQLNGTASSGLALTYSVSNTNIATVSGNQLTLLRPGTAVVTAAQAGDDNYTAATPVTDTVHYEAASLITQHWGDAIFFDNDSGDYVAWQWYKNDSLIPGATGPYYSDPPSLNGQYFVIATSQDGQQIQSCTLSIIAGGRIPGGIKVSPNPARMGEQVTITCNYSTAALQHALLQIVDVTGSVRQQIQSVQPSMPITLPSQAGIYIINLLLEGGAKASTNVLVLD